MKKHGAPAARAIPISPETGSGVPIHSAKPAVDNPVTPTRRTVRTPNAAPEAGARKAQIPISRNRTEHPQMPAGREISPQIRSGRQANSKVRSATARRGSRPITQAAIGRVVENATIPPAGAAA